jgi:hypothetical protein
MKGKFVFVRLRDAVDLSPNQKSMQFLGDAPQMKRVLWHFEPNLPLKNPVFGGFRLSFV